MKELIAQLERIARRANDNFSYDIELVPMKDGFYMEFVVSESADGHCIMGSTAPTMDGCASEIRKSLKQACKDWGYHYVD